MLFVNKKKLFLYIRVFVVKLMDMKKGWYKKTLVTSVILLNRGLAGNYIQLLNT